MSFLRQATAVDVLIGPFVDATDGDAEEGGLTITPSDVRLSINGQTAAAKTDVTNAAHDADGFYNCELDATDTATVGILVLYVHVAGALAVRHEYQVLEENVYDLLFKAAATGGTDIASILEDTAVIGALGAGLTGVPWNAAWDAEVQSEAADALVAYDPATHTELIAEIDAVQTDIAALNDPTAAAVAIAVWDALQSAHVTGGSFGELATEIALILGDTGELQGDDVPGLIAALNDPTAAAVAIAVWDALQASHVAGGSFGEIATEIASILVDTETSIPALIAALNDLSAADVQTELGTAWTTQIADSTPAHEARPTREQALLQTTRFLMERSTTGTVCTVTKEDGTTTVMTFNLDDDINPTSITRNP